VEKGQDSPTSTQVDSPRAILSARVDDKGRLDVPKELIAYLESAGITKLFITTTDMRMGRIYPDEVWKHNEKVFLDGRAKPGIGRLAFMARLHGDSGNVDKAGRLLLPAKLREVLQLNQRQTIWLELHNGVVNILTQNLYEERYRDSVANSAADQALAEEAGFI
jgi:DNA-binding transcriptional regulator/RsmH inhibitor MraZ